MGARVGQRSQRTELKRTLGEMENLGAALSAFEQGNRETALESAIEAWRETRDPRVAELVDRLAGKSEPLVGATLAKQLAAWKAALAGGRAVDLGRMLAAPWPGKWQSTEPLIDVLLAWPPDPRVARALTSLYVDRPWRSLTVGGFYRKILDGIVHLGDERSLSRMKEAPVLEESFAARRVPLSTEEAEALLALEKLLPREDGKTFEDYVNAIRAAPDDLALRNVFADWLVERGDPRGELMALQLSRREGRTSAPDRERKLIEKHGGEWAGELGKRFDPKCLVFEDGFFAGGILSYVRSDELASLLADPAWDFVRVLEPNEGIALSTLLARVPRLRALHLASLRAALALANGGPRAIEELSFRWDWLPEGQDPAPLHRLDDLPALRALHVGTERWRALLDAPVLARIERLGVEKLVEDDFRKLAELGRLREIEVVERSARDAFLEPSGWVLRFSRDTPSGPFTTAHAQWVLGRRANEWSKLDFLSTLAAVPEGWLRRLVVAPSRSLRLDAEDVQRVRVALERFPGIEVDAPWDLATSPVADDRCDLELQLTGAGFLEHAGEIHDLLKARGVQVDTLRLGLNGAPRPLGKDPRAKIVQWAKNPRVSELLLYRDGRPGRCYLAKNALSIDEAPNGTLDELLPWTARLLEGCVVEAGTVGPWTPNDELWPWARVAYGRITVLGREIARLVPDDALAGIPEAAGEPDLRIERHGDVLLLASDACTTGERRLALARALRAVVDRRVRALLGYDPIEVLGAGIAAAAAALGLTERHDEPNSWPLGVSFANHEGRRLLAQLWTPLTDPRVTVALRCKAPAGEWSRALVEWVTAPSRDDLERVLATACDKAVAEGPPFFANPEPATTRGR